VNIHPESTYRKHTVSLKELEKELEEHDKNEMHEDAHRKTSRRELPSSFYKDFVQMASVRSIGLDDYDIDPSINRNIDPYNDPSFACSTDPFNCSSRDLYNESQYASIGTFSTESFRSGRDLFISAVDFERANMNNMDPSTSNDENNKPFSLPSNITPNEKRLDKLILYRNFSGKSCHFNRSTSMSDFSVMLMKNNYGSTSSMESFPMNISGPSLNFHRSMSDIPKTSVLDDSTISSFGIPSNPSISFAVTSVFSSASLKEVSMEL